MITFKIKKVGNQWYPCLNHGRGFIDCFDEKINKYLNMIDTSKFEEITISLEELDIFWDVPNVIYFNEQDIVRYLTTDDDFDLRFVINNHEMTLSSNIFWLLENQFNLNFHKTSYSISIY